MDFKQLQYFYVVAKYENVSAASNELYVAQSALSKSIQRLESDLGTQLFIRYAKSLRLSPAGKELQKYLRTLLPAIDSIKPMLQDFEENYTKTLRLSVLASAANVSPLITKFSEEHPDVTITLNRSEDLRDSDLKFSYGVFKEDEEQSVLLMEHEYFLLVPNNFPLAKKDNVNFSDLQGIPYIQNISTRNVLLRINKAIEDAGVKLDERFRILDNNLLCSMVENGLGVAISPELPMLFSRYNFTVVPLEHHTITSPLYLSWSKLVYLPKTCRHFIEEACNYFGVEFSF